MAEDVPAFDDIPSFDDLPDGAPVSQQSDAVPAFDDIPSFDALPDDASGRPAPETALGTGVREAARAVVPTGAGLVGAGLGGAAAGALGAGPVGAFIGGIGGMVAASMGAGYAQDKALDAAGFDDSEQRAANVEAHPVAAFAGGLAPGVATMSPMVAGKAAQQVMQRGAGAVIGGAFEAGQDLVNEGHVDPAKAAAAAAVGAVFPGVNRVGQRVVGAGERLVPGRPNRTANPAADQAHVDVDDANAQIEVGNSSLAQTAHPATGNTTGNPQSAPQRSSRVYSKGVDPAEQARYAEAASDPEAMRQFAFDEGLTEAQAREIVQANYRPEGDMLTRGQADPATVAALEATNPAPASAVAPEQPAAAPRVAPQEPQPRPVMPEPSVEAGFPQAGDPVAMGANDATPLPPGTPERAAKAIARSKQAADPNLRPMPEIKGETPINDSITEAQRAAGNYPKARTHDFGKPQKIETHAGDTRRGKGPDGKEWEVELPYDYGYFNKTKGADKDHIDFARPKAGSPEEGQKFFVIDQKNAETGKFDEHKLFTYYKDEAAARAHYEAGFSDGKGAQRLGAITEVTRPELVKFLAKHTTRASNKPFGALESTPEPRSAKPVKERAVFKDLVAKKPEMAEALMNAPDEQIAAAIEGKRVRKYGVGTGSSAGYPVEGVFTSDGRPVTANTKAKATERAAAHKKVADWFAKTKAPENPDTESNGALLDRLKQAAPNIEGWKPSHKPKEWLLAREAQKVLMKPTPGNIKKFREAERLLRGDDASVEAYRGGNRIEADIAQSRRSGDDAIASAEAKQHLPGTNDVEDAMIADLDAKRAETAKQKNAKFDIPHEEAEAMVKQTPVKSKADLKELPRKTVSSTDSSLAKIDTKAISAAEMRKAEATKLAGKKSTKAAGVETEGAASGLKKPSIDIADPKEVERLRAMLDKASKKSTGIDALPAERAAKPRGVQDLLGDFVSDDRGSMDIGKIRADLKKWMGTTLRKTEHESYRAMELRTPEDKFAQANSDKLQALKKRVETHDVNILNRLDAMPKEVRLNKKLQAEIYHAREADSAHFPLPAGKTGTHVDNLSPEAKKVYDKYLQQVFDENDAIVEAIRRIAPEKIGPDVHSHISRLTKGDVSEMNVLKAHDDDPTNPGYHSLSVNADQAKARKFYALVGADGRRHVIGMADNGFTIWNKYKRENVKLPDFEFVDGETFTAGPNTYTMRQATSKEIEANALGPDKKPMKYYDNASFSAAIANKNLGTMAHNILDLHDIMQTPEFKKLTTRNEGKAKKMGWEESNFPNMKGLFMSPQLKSVFDDFAGRPASDLTKMNSFVTKTIFWMPVAHIRNVAEHWIVGRGWDNLSLPKNWKLATEIGPKAIMSVINQDGLQARLRDQGAGLIYGSVKTRRMVEKIANRLGMEIEQNPSKWGPIADKLGVTTKQLGRAVYDTSSEVMWSAGDMMLTMRVLENEAKGLKLKQAIIEAERDIPNYRVPHQSIGRGSKGREWAKLSQNSTLVAFGRYHHGMFNSYANIIKDAISSKATLGDRLDAIGKMMTMGAIAFILYPILDKGAQAITGNKEAHIAPRGPMSVPTHMAKGLRGEGDSSQWIRGSVTPAPLVSAALTWINGKDFRGKPILEPGTLRDATSGSLPAAGRAVVQGVEHTVRNVISPYGTFANTMQKNKPDEGAGTAVVKAVRDAALDIKDPSDRANRYKAMTPIRTNRENIQRFRRPPGPVEKKVGEWFGYR